MRFLYTLAWIISLPFAFLYLLWRSRRQPEYRRHWDERLGHGHNFRGRPLIWVHAVSVGETRAAAPLIHALRERYRNHTILLTHTTPTGRATGRQLYGDLVRQSYLPYDLPWLVKRFLERARPQLGIILETEIWPNLFAVCRRRDLPLYLVNARLSAQSAQGYARYSALVRPTLAALWGVAAQTDDDAGRLGELGAEDVVVTGNLKYDVALPPDTSTKSRVLRDLFGERFVFLAASTREGEEALILDVLHRIDLPDLLLALVPRHPQRFDEVARLLESRGLSYVRRSSGQHASIRTQVFLGDSMGELAAYYSAADLAFVGGSLLPLGGQNLIEAAAVGCPVLIGPHTFNFTEVANLAVSRGAAVRVADANELAEMVNTLSAAPDRLARMSAAGADFTAENRGATARVLAMIAKPTPGAG